MVDFRMYVITGGGSGIGRALAHTLSERNKQVLVVGRRRQTLDETASFSPLIQTCCADVSSLEGRQKISETLFSIDSIEGLVHNAGIITPIEAISVITENEWQQVIDINLNAPLFLTQQLLGKLNGGRVLNIGSAVAYFPVQGWAPYCVSKAGLSMLTRCWQLESANPAFASVMPGIIDTDMQAIIRQTTAMCPEKRNYFVTLQQENRLVTPETAALFLSFLLLDVSIEDYVLQEWDIYDTKHHSLWLTTPHHVPHWE